MTYYTKLTKRKEKQTKLTAELSCEHIQIQHLHTYTYTPTVNTHKNDLTYKYIVYNYFL